MSTNIIENTSNKITDAHRVIDELFTKYANNPYMLERTYNYICQQLPNQLEVLDRTHELRISRIEELTVEQHAFITEFIAKNQYFYVPATELFYHYDGKHYRLYNEDDILHQILTLITKDKQLMCWKQRTKVYIMKRIKENILLKSVPESYTIQNVLSVLHPTIFSTRTEAKYFLTIIGDNIFKKNSHLIHFLHANSKHFIRELNAMCQGFLGTNLFQTIKHKYHEHSYQHSRILKINDIIKNEAIWRPLLMTWSLDILCVACHYSMRFNCSDDFLLHTNDEPLCQSVFYLNRNDPSNIVDHFIADYLQKNQRQPTRATRSLQNEESSHNFSSNTDEIDSKNITGQITWKNMQYLWKYFLESKNLPAILFQQALKTIFTQKLSEYYKPEIDSFVGIFSKHLPAIQKFISFWEETITIQEDDIEHDFEIDELSILFKLWCENQGETVSSFNHSQLLNLIDYFYPNIEIDQDKYIYKIHCSLWDKQLDVQTVMESLLENGERLSLYDAYRFYCQNCPRAKQTLIVSKSYFEKCVYSRFSDYIS
uniref:Uncharacterized protein n=1 Tax=viral metagenome TaxID=1070528 RepID=A0A6C0K0U2_9ZZZZ